MLKNAERLKSLTELLNEVNYLKLSTKNDRNAYLTFKAEKAKLEEKLGYKELAG